MPVSMAMAMISFLSRLHNLDSKHPKPKPSHGKAKPAKAVLQVINFSMKNWDQMPQTNIKTMGKSARGFMNLTMKFATLGKHFRMEMPMRRGTTRRTAYLVMVK